MESGGQQLSVSPWQQLHWSSLPAGIVVLSVCMFVCLCVRMSIFLDVSVGCARARLSGRPIVPDQPEANTPPILAPLMLTSEPRTQLQPFLSHSLTAFFQPSSRNRGGQGTGPWWKHSLGKERDYLTFPHLSCLFLFCLMPFSSSLWSSNFEQNYFIIFRSQLHFFFWRGGLNYGAYANLCARHRARKQSYQRGKHRVK